MAIGFEMTVYTTLEGDTQRVCVIVMSPGVLAATVMVTINNEDGTAQGDL